VAYFETLRPEPLNATGVYAVYSVPGNGELKVHSQTLKAGSRVFVDPNDKPILLVICGNPLTLGPGSLGARNPLTQALGTGPLDDDLKAVVNPGMSEGDSLSPTMLLDTPTEPGPLTYNPVTPEDLLGPGLSPATAGSLSGAGGPGPAGGGGGGGYGYLGALVPIGGLIWATSTTGGHAPVAPTPEPAPILLLGLGSGAVMIRGLKRRK
jgi:hypothetical protein